MLWIFFVFFFLELCVKIYYALNPSVFKDSPPPPPLNLNIVLDLFNTVVQFYKTILKISRIKKKKMKLCVPFFEVSKF